MKKELKRGMAVIWERWRNGQSLRIRSRVVRVEQTLAIVCPDVKDWRKYPASLCRIATVSALFPV